MDGISPAIDVLGVLRGCIGAVVGVEDWDVSRMGEATEMVVYVFENRAPGHHADRDGGAAARAAMGRASAQYATRELRQARDMRLADVDRAFGTDTQDYVLGSGKPPNDVRPLKVRVLAEHGFKLSLLQAFERVVDIIERKAWDEHPGARSQAPDARRGAIREALGKTSDRFARLDATPRIDGEEARSRREPDFPVPVIGYDRTIRPNSWGTDRFGNPVKGYTYVRETVRYKNKLPPSAIDGTALEAAPA